MTIGLIGYGRFGRLAARFLARYGKVVVYDRRTYGESFPSRNIKEGSLSFVAAQRIVILAVPISSLQQILRSISPSIQPNALVIDVCSVKMKPVKWMKHILPKTTSLLGTHPLFGPDTVLRSVRGHRVVVCPVRISQRKLWAVKERLRRAGLEVETMTPNDHDRMIAETLLLTQYIGRLVGHADVRRWSRSTRTYETLRWLADVAEHDSRVLFQDMFRFNPYARRLLRSLDKGQRRVRRELNIR